MEDHTSSTCEEVVTGRDPLHQDYKKAISYKTAIMQSLQRIKNKIKKDQFNTTQDMKEIHKVLLKLYNQMLKNKTILNKQTIKILEAIISQLPDINYINQQTLLIQQINNICRLSLLTQYKKQQGQSLLDSFAQVKKTVSVISSKMPKVKSVQGSQAIQVEYPKDNIKIENFTSMLQVEINKYMATLQQQEQEQNQLEQVLAEMGQEEDLEQSSSASQEPVQQVQPENVNIEVIKQYVHTKFKLVNENGQIKSINQIADVIDIFKQRIQKHLSQKLQNDLTLSNWLENMKKTTDQEMLEDFFISWNQVENNDPVRFITLAYMSYNKLQLERKNKTLNLCNGTKEVIKLQTDDSKVKSVIQRMRDTKLPIFVNTKNKYDETKIGSLYEPQTIDDSQLIKSQYNQNEINKSTINILQKEDQCQLTIIKPDNQKVEIQDKFQLNWIKKEGTTLIPHMKFSDCQDYNAWASSVTQHNKDCIKQLNKQDIYKLPDQFLLQIDNYFGKDTSNYVFYFQNTLSQSSSYMKLQNHEISETSGIITPQDTYRLYIDTSELFTSKNTSYRSQLNPKTVTDLIIQQPEMTIKSQLPKINSTYFPLNYSDFKRFLDTINKTINPEVDTLANQNSINVVYDELLEQYNVISFIRTKDQIFNINLNSLVQFFENFSQSKIYDIIKFSYYQNQTFSLAKLVDADYNSNSPIPSIVRAVLNTVFKFRIPEIGSQTCSKRLNSQLTTDKETQGNLKTLLIQHQNYCMITGEYQKDINLRVLQNLKQYFKLNCNLEEDQPQFQLYYCRESLWIKDNTQTEDQLTYTKLTLLEDQCFHNTTTTMGQEARDEVMVYLGTFTLMKVYNIQQYVPISTMSWLQQHDWLSTRVATTMQLENSQMQIVISSASSMILQNCTGNFTVIDTQPISVDEDIPTTITIFYEQDQTQLILDNNLQTLYTIQLLVLASTVSMQEVNRDFSNLTNYTMQQIISKVFSYIESPIAMTKKTKSRSLSHLEKFLNNNVFLRDIQSIANNTFLNNKVIERIQAEVQSMGQDRSIIGNIETITNYLSNQGDQDIQLQWNLTRGQHVTIPEFCSILGALCQDGINDLSTLDRNLHFIFSESFTNDVVKQSQFNSYLTRQNPKNLNEKTIAEKTLIDPETLQQFADLIQEFVKQVKQTDLSEYPFVKYIIQVKKEYNKQNSSIHYRKTECQFDLVSTLPLDNPSLMSYGTLCFYHNQSADIPEETMQDMDLIVEHYQNMKKIAKEVPISVIYASANDLFKINCNLLNLKQTVDDAHNPEVTRWQEQLLSIQSNESYKYLSNTIIDLGQIQSLQLEERDQLTDLDRCIALRDCRELLESIQQLKQGCMRQALMCSILGQEYTKLDTNMNNTISSTDNLVHTIVVALICQKYADAKDIECLQVLYNDNLDYDIITDKTYIDAYGGTSSIRSKQKAMKQRLPVQHYITAKFQFTPQDEYEQVRINDVMANVNNDLRNLSKDFYSFDKDSQQDILNNLQKSFRRLYKSKKHVSSYYKEETDKSKIVPPSKFNQQALDDLLFKQDNYKSNKYYLQQSKLTSLNQFTLRNIPFKRIFQKGQVDQDYVSAALQKDYEVKSVEFIDRKKYEEGTTKKARMIVTDHNQQLVRLGFLEKQGVEMQKSLGSWFGNNQFSHILRQKLEDYINQFAYIVESTKLDEIKDSDLNIFIKQGFDVVALSNQPMVINELPSNKLIYIIHQYANERYKQLMENYIDILSESVESDGLQQNLKLRSKDPDQKFQVNGQDMTLTEIMGETMKETILAEQCVLIDQWLGKTGCQCQTTHCNNLDEPDEKGVKYVYGKVMYNKYYKCAVIVLLQGRMHDTFSYILVGELDKHIYHDLAIRLNIEHQWDVNQTTYISGIKQKQIRDWNWDEKDFAMGRSEYLLQIKNLIRDKDGTPALSVIPKHFQYVETRGNSVVEKIRHYLRQAVSEFICTYHKHNLPMTTILQSVKYGILSMNGQSMFNSIYDKYFKTSLPGQAMIIYQALTANKVLSYFSVCKSKHWITDSRNSSYDFKLPLTGYSMPAKQQISFCQYMAIFQNNNDTSFVSEKQVNKDQYKLAMDSLEINSHNELKYTPQYCNYTSQNPLFYKRLHTLEGYTQMKIQQEKLQSYLQEKIDLELSEIGQYLTGHNHDSIKETALRCAPYSAFVMTLTVQNHDQNNMRSAYLRACQKDLNDYTNTNSAKLGNTSVFNISQLYMFYDAIFIKQSRRKSVTLCMLYSILFQQETGRLFSEYLISISVKDQYGKGRVISTQELDMIIQKWIDQMWNQAIRNNYFEGVLTVSDNKRNTIVDAVQKLSIHQQESYPFNIFMQDYKAWGDSVQTMILSAVVYGLGCPEQYTSFYNLFSQKFYKKRLAYIPIKGKNNTVVLDKTDPDNPVSWPNTSLYQSKVTSLCYSGMQQGLLNCLSSIFQYITHQFFCISYQSLYYENRTLRESYYYHQNKKEHKLCDKLSTSDDVLLILVADSDYTDRYLDAQQIGNTIFGICMNMSKTIKQTIYRAESCVLEINSYFFFISRIYQAPTGDQDKHVRSAMLFDYFQNPLELQVNFLDKCTNCIKQNASPLDLIALRSGYIAYSWYFYKFRAIQYLEEYKVRLTQTQLEKDLQNELNKLKSKWLIDIDIDVTTLSKVPSLPYLLLQYDCKYLLKYLYVQQAVNREYLKQIDANKDNIESRFQMKGIIETSQRLKINMTNPKLKLIEKQIKDCHLQLYSLSPDYKHNRIQNTMLQVEETAKFNMAKQLRTVFRGRSNNPQYQLSFLKDLLSENQILTSFYDLTYEQVKIFFDKMQRNVYSKLFNSSIIVQSELNHQKISQLYNYLTQCQYPDLSQESVYYCDETYFVTTISMAKQNIQLSDDIIMKAQKAFQLGKEIGGFDYLPNQTDFKEREYTKLLNLTDEDKIRIINNVQYQSLPTLIRQETFCISKSSKLPRDQLESLTTTLSNEQLGLYQNYKSEDRISQQYLLNALVMLDDILSKLQIKESDDLANLQKNFVAQYSMASDNKERLQLLEQNRIPVVYINGDYVYSQLAKSNFLSQSILIRQSINKQQVFQYREQDQSKILVHTGYYHQLIRSLNLIRLSENWLIKYNHVDQNVQICKYNSSSGIATVLQSFVSQDYSNYGDQEVFITTQFEKTRAHFPLSLPLKSVLNYQRLDADTGIYTHQRDEIYLMGKYDKNIQTDNLLKKLIVLSYTSWRSIGIALRIPTSQELQLSGNLTLLYQCNTISSTHIVDDLFKNQESGQEQASMSLQSVSYFIFSCGNRRCVLSYEPQVVKEILFYHQEFDKFEEDLQNLPYDITYVYNTGQQHRSVNRQRQLGDQYILDKLQRCCVYDTRDYKTFSFVENHPVSNIPEPMQIGRTIKLTKNYLNNKSETTKIRRYYPLATLAGLDFCSWQDTKISLINSNMSNTMNFLIANEEQLLQYYHTGISFQQFYNIILKDLLGEKSVQIVNNPGDQLQGCVYQYLCAENQVEIYKAAVTKLTEESVLINNDELVVMKDWFKY